jgi:signal transduction histidine kinase/ligand-binding sensor domain-containing protein/DNA-binding response OmpR family regulator
MPRKRYILLLLALLLSWQAGAQMARLYSASSRLPSVSVNAIMQDADGYIWISSESGLARFDGNEFISFQTESDNPFSLRSDRVYQTLQDVNGRLWVATSSALQVFRPETSDFETFNLEPDALPGTRHHISYMEEVRVSENESFLYVAVSGDGGLFVINTRTMALDEERRSALRPHVTNRTRYLFKDSKSRLWIALGSGGLYFLDAKDPLRLQEPAWAPDLSSQRGTIVVQGMAEDPKTGKLLLCTVEHGLLLYEPEKNLIRKTAGSALSKAVYPNVAIFLGDRFLVGTEDHGLKSLDPETEILTDASFPNQPFHISSWKIRSLTEDRQGNLWVGAYLTGVLVIPRPAYGFDYRNFSLTGAIGDNSGCITGVVRTADGTLWASSDGSGLFRVNRDGTTDRFDSTNSRLGSDILLSLCLDKRGKLWLSTYGHGLMTYTSSGGFAPFQDADRFPSKRVSFIRYDEVSDRLFVGTSGAGLVVVDAKNERIVQVYCNENIRYVSALAFDPEARRLWVGGTYVLFYYDVVTEELNPLLPENNVMRERVNCLAKRGQELWIGTGRGLVRFRLDTRESKIFTTRDGLSSNLTQALHLCDNGDVWVSTSYGLNLIQGGEGPILRFFDFDGLQGNQFYRGAEYGDADGTVYFGGVGGLTSFRPDSFCEQNHPMPPISLSRFSVLNQPVELSSDARRGKYLEIPADGHYFSIGFSVLEYTNPQKVKYQYRMEGFDKGWQEGEGSDRLATYTNLPPGRYTFQVRASFDGEPENASVTSLPVVIRRPWYLQGWAYLIYALAALLLINFIIGLIRERKQNTLQALKLKTVSDLAHEIRTPIGLVSSPLKKLRDQEPEGDRRETYDLMLQSCRRIDSIINQLLDVRKLDEGKVNFRFSRMDLIPLIQSAVQSFGIQAREKHVTVQFIHGRKGAYAWIDPAHFDKIIYNLLSNAFKYTPEGGSVVVTLGEPEPNEGILSANIQEIRTLSVYNSGSSVSRKELPHLFDRYYQASNAKEGSGVGLNLAKTLVEAHDGKISAENAGGGMMFKVVLPCGSAHIPADRLRDSVPTFRPVAEVPVAGEDRKRIVVVDDDEQIGRYIQSELSDKYAVYVFRNGEAAWKHILKTAPDVVVTDLLMPGMDGEELCRRIKETPETRFTSVIVLSACADEDVQAAANKAGAARYLTKPLSMDLLESSIDQLLAEKEAYRKSSGLVFDFSSVRMNTASDHLVTAVLEAVRANYENSEYSVDQLSRDVGVSRVHLNRRLQELMGIAPSVLIREIRLRQAAYLLSSRGASVSEVAYKVGFSSQTYFSTSFRKRFSMTPSEFVASYADLDSPDKFDRLFKFPFGE